MNFSDMNPLFWRISTYKGIILRNINDCLSKENFASIRLVKKLPYVVSQYQSHMIKKGKGIDPVSQSNKAININIASSKITGIIIHPNETFSFWRLVGSISKRKGYKNGRVLRADKLISDTGGGLCNLANTINNVILNSPLEIVEFHKHSDALACDIDHRVPMANGTSVSYNYIDYRFKNNTDQDVQIILWREDDTLYAQLRSNHEFPYAYKIVEKNHHFEKENDKYYRVSKIYRYTIDKTTNKIIHKQLIWDNHSLVMFDPSLIPADQIINPNH